MGENARKQIIARQKKTRLVSDQAGHPETDPHVHL